MNKIGIHICYWWGTGYENDIHQLIRLTKETGADVMEMTLSWLLNTDSAGRRALRAEMDAVGIEPTVNGGLVEENDISSHDPLIREKGIEYCKRALDAMYEMGITVWSGSNYSAWLKKPSAPIDDEQRRRDADIAVRSLRQIMPAAEAAGVDFCFEVLNRFEQYLFNTSQEAVEFAQAVGSPRAKLLLDTYHMNIEEDSITDAIDYAAKHGRLGHIHIGESNRRIPGTGKTHMDWDGIMKAIVNTGYTGVLTMEPFVLTNASNAHRTCTWRQTCRSNDIDSLVADVRTGAEFLRSKLR